MSLLSLRPVVSIETPHKRRVGTGGRVGAIHLHARLQLKLEFHAVGESPVSLKIHHGHRVREILATDAPIEGLLGSSSTKPTPLPRCSFWGCVGQSVVYSPPSLNIYSCKGKLHLSILRTNPVIHQDSWHWISTAPKPVVPYVPQAWSPQVHWRTGNNNQRRVYPCDTFWPASSGSH